MAEPLKKIGSDITMTLADIWRDTQTLFRQEMALLRIELKEEVTSRRSLMLSWVKAGVCGLTAAFLSAFALVYGLAQSLHIELWLSYLMTASFFAVLTTVWLWVAKGKENGRK